MSDGPRKDSAGPSPCPRCSVTLFGDSAKPGRLPFSPHEPLGHVAPRQLELLLLFSRFALLEMTKRQMLRTGSVGKKKVVSGVGADEGLRLDSLSAYSEDLDLLVCRIVFGLAQVALHSFRRLAPRWSIVVVKERRKWEQGKPVWFFCPL